MSVLFPQLQPPPARRFMASHLLDGVIPQGALTAFQGNGKTEVLLRLLAEDPAARVAWIEWPWSIYPAAFPGFGVDLGRVLFIASGSHAESLWIAAQVLKSGLFPWVIISGICSTETELRRLQLTAERAGSAVILLLEKPATVGWALAQKISVWRGEKGDLHVEIEKRGRSHCLPAFPAAGAAIGVG